jgi:membrane AbrB-like protein
MDSILRGRLAAFSLAVMGGWLAHKLHVPLAWVLGPLVTTVLFSVGLGVRVFAPVVGRRMGQVVIGSTLGLAVTPSVASQVLPYLWLMILVPFLSIGISGLISLSLARISGLDRRTAFFCMVPGGLSEMANIGDRYGARREPIALAQAIRVALVVLTFPPFMVMLGWDGQYESFRDFSPLQVSEALWFALLSVLGVVVTRLIRFNNPWMVGALLGAATGSVMGLYSGSIPREIFYAAQFLLGISIGSRFERERVLRLGRFAVLSIGFTFVLGGAFFVMALIVAYLSGIDRGTAALAMSPGGFAEMTTTAEVLHLNILMVTGFHVARAVIINGLSGHALKSLEWVVGRLKHRDQGI